MTHDERGTAHRPAASAAIPHWHSPDSSTSTIVEGAGARVYDDEGREYLDFMSQLYCANAGYDNEAIGTAIQDQIARIPYVSSAKGNDVRDAFATELAEVAPGHLSDVFFAVSGSEANEAAIQFAREHQDASKILTRWNSYHGSTYAAAGLTGDPTARNAVEQHAAATGVVKFLPPLDYRSPFDADTPEDLARQAADHLEFVIRNEGPESIAALLTEPIGGTSGAFTAPPGYFERVRELCDEYDILLISDEVITGFGRCGDWFGIATEGVEPDMITFAKAATGAYVPLGGVIVTPEIAERVHTQGTDVGQTFAGHPLGCAAGVAAIEEYRGGLIDNVVELAPQLEEGLRDIGRRHDAVGDVRGRGFHWSLEFTDPETGEPYLDPWLEEGDNPVKAVRSAAGHAGVLFGSGRPDTQILVSPPLCVDAADIEHAVSTLDEAIGAVFDA